MSDYQTAVKRFVMHSSNYIVYNKTNGQVFSCSHPLKDEVIVIDRKELRTETPFDIEDMVREFMDKVD